jgi:hypothetical protein
MSPAVFGLDEPYERNPQKNGTDAGESKFKAAQLVFHNGCE